MWNHIHKSQIEKQYGGDAENLTEYWPPKVTSTQYFVEADNAGDILITKEEYKAKKEAGELAKYRVKDF